MENSPRSAKPNSQSEKEEEEEKSNGSNYFLKDSDVHCQQGTFLMKNAMMEGPSVNIGSDLPQAEALISVVPKRKRKRKRKRARSSAPIINNLEPDFSDNTESVPVESRPNVVMKRSHAPKIGDFNPDCLKGALSSENITPENNSCMQYSGRDAHHDSSLGAYTLLEEPSINVISDLVPAELPPHVNLSRRKRKKKKTTIGAAPEPENSCLASCAGICSTPNSEKAKQHADLPSLQRKKKMKQNEWRKIDETDSNDRSCASPRTNEELSCSQGKMKNKWTKMSKAHENSYKSCDLSVGTSLVENIMPTVDPSLQPPVTESLEQELAVAQSPVEGISTKTNSESSELIADLSCSRKKKKKIRKEGCKTQETNDESCGNDKICDLSVGTSLVENIMPGIDHSQQPPVSEFSEQKLELPPPLMEGISTKTNSESSGPFADSSCSRKKKKKLKTHESNDRRCELSVGTLVENIMPGTDSSQQPPVLEFTDQKLELPQPLMEGISTTANSEGPEPNANLSCSKEKKKKNWKRGHKTHESNDRRSDPSLGTSLEGNIIPGADLSVQPPVAIFSEQDLEVEQPLVDGIGKITNSESPKPIEDLSCSQKMKQKNGKKRRKICESNDESCDPSGDTSLVENIIPGADPYLQHPLAILSEQELEVPQILLEDSTFQEKNEDKEQNKRSNASGNNDTDHDICAGLPCQVLIDVKADENNNDNSLSEVSKLDPTNIQDITDIEQTETKTEVPSLPPLAVKADVDVTVNVKEGNLSQISDCAAERSLVSCSKKKLLILDINGLLADILPQECHILKRYKPDITISRKAVFKRPFCDDFLQFCFDRFNVGVWSSRTKKNVDMVIDFLLGDSRHKLLFCWNQSHCTTTRFNTIDNTDKPLVLKELRKLWEKHDPNLPWVKGEYNESNTLLLDDSPYKALRNPENTAIFPYSYECRDRRDASLGPGGKIRSFLEGLAMADNVQKYVEQHPFGQRPITQSSLSWGFYRRVMEDEVESPKD